MKKLTFTVTINLHDHIKPTKSIVTSIAGNLLNAIESHINSSENGLVGNVEGCDTYTSSVVINAENVKIPATVWSIIQ